MEYVFGVRSVLDGVSRFYVRALNSAEVGDIVSFDTDDGEQFAVVERVCLANDKEIEMLEYVNGEIYPINALFGLSYRRNPDARTP